MSSLRYVGEKLYLGVQVGEDLSVGFASAFLSDQDDNFLSQVDLNYDGDGRFSENTETMPNVTLLKVTYKIFEDAARTLVNDFFPWVDYCYKKNELLPTQLPDTTDLEVQMGEDKELNTNFDDQPIGANFDESDIAAKFEEDPEIGADTGDKPEIGVNVDSDNVSSKFDC